MRQQIDQIRQAANGDRALHLIREVSTFHRIQASTGYRAAAEHVAKRLKHDGLEVKIRQYPADGKSWSLVQKMFLEWDIQDATLWLAGTGECLADFKANNLSVIQRSHPADFRNQPVDIVLLDRGDQPEAYKGLDLKGKLIFVRDHFQGFMDWAIKEGGALGFITDYIRDMEGIRVRYDLHDIYNYTSFWWKHTPDEPRTFGFVLTPRQGDALAQKCRAQLARHEKDKKQPKYLQATGFVNASLYEGFIEVVDSFIPGQTKDEVLLVSHLCHPRSCANDNSSGVSASMEAMKVIHDLVGRGVLKKPRRGIRMINPPEFTGTFAYLAELGDGVKRVKAGLNMDMVGARQSDRYGPIGLSCTSHAVPSVVGTVGALVMDEVKKNAPGHTRGNFVAMFNTAVKTFEGGSDHIILSDPAIGVPTPMLGQWPDKTYHSSGDVVEVIDPYVLQKSVAICAGYLYSLANLAEEDIPLVLNKARERFMTEVTQAINRAVEGDLTDQQLHDLVQQLTGYYLESNLWLEGFCSGKLGRKARDAIERENAFIRQTSDALWERYVQDHAPGFMPARVSVPEKYQYVPVRTAKSKGPPVHMDDFTLDDPKKARAYADYNRDWRSGLESAHAFDCVVQYNIDGKRTLHEIAQRTITEMGEGSVEYVHEFVQLLKLFGLVEVKKEYHAEK